MKHKDSYWSGAHTLHKLKAHLVFIPKYRKRILRGEIVQTIKTLFYEACEVNDWNIEEYAIEKDHIHILLQYKPNESIAKIVQILKWWSSFKLRKMYPEIEEFLWWDSFWSDGYFAESVWVHHEQLIKQYIQNQGQ